MSRLALYLLGPPRVELDSEPVHIGRRKAVALLAYLAVERGIHSRDTLATMFWLGYDQSTARAHLRRALASLSRRLGSDWVVADRETVAFSPDTELWLDVDRFCKALAASEAHRHSMDGVCADCLASLSEAVALYNDDFMAGFTLPDSPDFEEWQRHQTQKLRDEFGSMLERLALAHAAEGDYGEAIAYAQHWSALDPLRERPHRRLMALYVQAGRCSAALRQYQECARVLEQELGVKPSPETTALYEQLLKEEGTLAPAETVEPESMVVAPCPYRGLAVFRETDAPFFFGREGFSETLYQAVNQRPFVAIIVGSSGSGKSSAVFAGLLPRLREEGGWLIASLRPGGRPFEALAAAVHPALEPQLSESDRLIETGKLANAISAGDLDLFAVVKRVGAKNPSCDRLLLVVDQFEELYTLCPEPDMQARFLDALLLTAETAAKRHESPFVVLITMRADFMGQALAYRPFADALQDGSLMMGPMNREEMRAAVEMPAQMQDVAFDDGLAEWILDDVGDKPGNLPLLEFALTLLWERQSERRLTHAAYEKMGRVEGALARYADEVYAKLDAIEREKARQVFVQLVRPGVGTEDTRRVATRTDLGDDDENWELAQHLADTRLLVTGRDAVTGDETVEVVHETLIQRWGKLREWIEEDRAFRTWQERLRVAHRAWETSERDEGALLRGGPLAEAEDWLGQRRDALSPNERAYIEAGVERRERRQAAQEQRRRRALHQASVGLAASALAELGGPAPERAVLLALEALEGYPYTPQAESALAQAVEAYTPYIELNSEWKSFRTEAIAWHPDGGKIAATGIDHWEGIIIWDLGSGAQTDAIRMADEYVLTDIAWAPSGFRLVATGYHFRTGYSGSCLPPTVWDVQTHRKRLTFTGHEGRVNSVDWSPDGETILSGGVDGTARTWDAVEGVEHLALRGHTGSVEDASWSPDGALIATASTDGTARVWDANTGTELVTLSGHANAVNSTAWSPDGTRVATGSADGTVRVWQLSRSSGSSQRLDGGAVIVDVKISFSLSGHDDQVRDVAWSPDGGRIATASADGTARVWDAATGEGLLTLYGRAGRVLNVAWSPAGDRLVIAGVSIVRVWDVSRQLRKLTGHADEVWGAHWSPEGNRIATASRDGTVKLWDAATGEETLTLDHPVSAMFVAWSLDGARVVTTSDDGWVRIWEPETGELLVDIPARLRGPLGWVSWSPDGSRFAVVSGSDGSVTVFDATTGDAETVFHMPDEGPSYASWSPEGDRIVVASQGWAASPAYVWDANTGETLAVLGGEGAAHSEWSPDGARIAVTYADGSVTIFDAVSHTELLTFEGHVGGVWQAKWSPNGARVASAGESGVVRVWDASSGAEVYRFAAPGSIYTLDWSPDGNDIIATGASNKPVIFRVWQSTEELVAYAKKCCVTRELTDEERVQFGLPIR